MESPKFYADEVARFDRRTVIELTDLVGGFRKLAVVTEDLVSHYDTTNLENNQIWPTFIKQNPVAVGDPADWLVDLFFEGEESGDLSQHAAYSEMQDELLTTCPDTLTYYRACYWALKNRDYDAAKALAAGQSETDKVVAALAAMDKVVEAYQLGEVQA